MTKTKLTHIQRIANKRISHYYDAYRNANDNETPPEIKWDDETREFVLCDTGYRFTVKEMGVITRILDRS